MCNINILQVINIIYILRYFYNGVYISTEWNIYCLYCIVQCEIGEYVLISDITFMIIFEYLITTHDVRRTKV